jgi:hypothetical protein
VLLDESMQERYHRFGATSTVDINSKQQFQVGFDCGVHPLVFAVNGKRITVDGDDGLFSVPGGLIAVINTGNSNTPLTSLTDSLIV